jgi:hypothetical protein
MEGKIYDTSTGEEFPISRINDMDGFDYKGEGFQELVPYILMRLNGTRHYFEEGRLKFGEVPKKEHEPGVVILGIRPI